MLKAKRKKKTAITEFKAYYIKLLNSGARLESLTQGQKGRLQNLARKAKVIPIPPFKVEAKDKANWGSRISAHCLINEGESHNKIIRFNDCIEFKNGVIIGFKNLIQCECKPEDYKSNGETVN